MKSRDESSAERLEALLQEGKISEEEYQTLRGALERKAGEEALTGTRTTTPRLVKSATNRVLGGVCAGIAEHFNVDPLLVRLAAVLIGMFTCVASLVLYAILYLLLPVAEEGQVRPERSALKLQVNFSWAFALLVSGLWLLHAFFITFTLPLAFELFDETRPALPAIMQVVLGLRRCTANYLYAYLQVVLLVLVTVVYAVLPPGGKGRRTLLRIICYGSLLLVLIYAFAFGPPLWQSLSEASRPTDIIR